jgi:hypothetical protein
VTVKSLSASVYFPVSKNRILGFVLPYACLVDLSEETGFPLEDRCKMGGLNTKVLGHRCRVCVGEASLFRTKDWRRSQAILLAIFVPICERITYFVELKTLE